MKWLGHTGMLWATPVCWEPYQFLKKSLKGNKIDSNAATFLEKNES
jgi:hypothetical protein